jgi:hypothetical protein
MENPRSLPETSAIQGRAAVPAQMWRVPATSSMEIFGVPEDGSKECKLFLRDEANGPWKLGCSLGSNSRTIYGNVIGKEKQGVIEP